jgi:hypothetical protein
MAKEQVYIVLMHKHSLKPGTRDQWEVQETVEFVSQLRNKHHSMASACGDFLNRKMISGSRHGFADYAVFEDYIEKKYEKQLTELRNAYPRAPLPEAVKPTLVKDQFGNERTPTVFDPQ